MPRPSQPPATRLSDLARWAGEHLTPLTERLGSDPEITGVTLSTRRVRAGDLYAALPGARAHGADFADDAVAQGAVAVLTDPDGAGRVDAEVPLLVVEEPRGVLGRLSAHVYGEPAAAMTTVGVTGTQGKTTTTRLLEAALTQTGHRAAVVGTVGTRVAGEDIATSLTTPEAPDLHGLLGLMREREVALCAMEVSSHALVLGRVDGVVFDVAVFLNLGRDHLDFHADVEEYYRAKASLFTPERCRRALVNLDDEHGRRLAGEVRALGLPLTTFSAEGRDADWRALDLEPGPRGTSFRVRGPEDVDLRALVRLPGAFNVSNALAALAAGVTAGVDAHDLVRGLATSEVPGRLELAGRGEGFEVLVDYAHKPDAVEAVLTTLRAVTPGRVVVVLGAGGDRDRGKRPIMGEIAARLADVVVVTDDNPRTEDPATIRAAVLEGARGVEGGAEVREVGDRRAAVHEAVALARPGDVVLVAGKGHETGQEVDGVVHPFDDREVARQALDGLGAAGGSL
ncbi:UDP-N-acetylmuramoyl-L-alanyl-D-glutamate--2,6-diaminopimelate ligase [Nocardioides nanhaiensis]|uniref:UDP-N-acetylmuramoyl-L-alanyl-D-glutamate--2,6-diaminopimelate ligase n=1 Tax=Nocardioides nanhaiensis TaxID=1476871 RepID=A0ABP8WT80_9ACTN